MKFKIANVVGVLCSDPKLPGHMYLTEEGTLTKDIKKARLVDPDQLERALKEAKEYSPKTFHNEVVPYYE